MLGFTRQYAYSLICDQIITLPSHTNSSWQILTGATLLIRIPFETHSKAKVFVKLSIPALAAPECLMEK